jgi:hypothetical protein
MKFTNDANMNFSGLKGEFPITYAELVEIFGLPKYGPNADLDKTTCEWALTFEDGTRASIYDYKTPGTPMFEYDWHIGGFDDLAVERVTECIRLHRDKLVKMVREYQPNERVTG